MHVRLDNNTKIPLIHLERHAGTLKECPHCQDSKMGGGGYVCTREDKTTCHRLRHYVSYKRYKH